MAKNWLVRVCNLFYGRSGSSWQERKSVMITAPKVDKLPDAFNTAFNALALINGKQEAVECDVLSTLLAKDVLGKFLTSDEKTQLAAWESKSFENRIAKELLRDRPWDRPLSPDFPPAPDVWPDLERHIHRTAKKVPFSRKRKNQF